MPPTITTDTATALLIVAHGSRRQRSNEEIREVARRVKAQSADRFKWVTCAFLELTEPSIERGIDDCVELGAQTVIIMPYFLAAGRHVAEDVPRIVETKRLEYPAVNLYISTYLGASPSMAGLILDTVDAGKCLCGEASYSDCQYPACMQR